MTLPENSESRLLHRSVLDPETGCRLWQGSLNPRGYGNISILGKTRPVHRVAHELWLGPIPEGFEIDHVYTRGCRNKNCIEPKHLEAVSSQVNTQRWKDLTTHCPQGHEYTPENTAIWNNARTCKKCKHRKVECGDCGKSLSRNHLAEHRRNVHGVLA